MCGIWYLFVYKDKGRVIVIRSWNGVELGMDKGCCMVLSICGVYIV